MIQKDIKEIVCLSRQNEKENWKFRAFLKKVKLSSRIIDRIVYSLAENISPEIDCKTCANCCTKISPIFKNKDIDRLSSFLHIKPVDFIQKYLLRDEDDDLVFKSMPCPFLKDKLCSIYDARPDNCKGYPHLYENHFVARLINVLNNYPLCPIVFNVFEELKKNDNFKRFKRSGGQTSI
jgi:uncharacterized protein